MKKILIIKIGYSETLDRRISLTANLGDVLRTTFILNYFKDEEITWLVDSSAYPLLDGNKYIDRIVVYNSPAMQEIQAQAFDLVINLEKIPKIYSLLKRLKYKRLLGFGVRWFNQDLDDYFDCLKGSKDLIEISRDFQKKRTNTIWFQEILANALGKDWRGDPYLLGYQPKSKVIFDVGFNWTTSNKWINKAWPKESWEKLEGLLRPDYTISWQKGFDNLYEYMEWINSCRSIITADTLGLHIALALQKRVVALFGPTSPQEIFLYHCGSVLVPEVDRACIPCCLPYCQRNDPCIKKISPAKVKEQIEHEVKQCICSRDI